MERLIEQIKNLDNITTHNFECSYFNDVKLVRMDDVIKLIEEAKAVPADTVQDVLKRIIADYKKEQKK